MFDVAAVPAQLGQVLAGLTARGSDATLVDWVSVVEGCQRVICAAQAAQTVALAHVAATEDVALPDGTVVEQHRGLGHRRWTHPRSSATSWASRTPERAPAWIRPSTW